MVTRFVGVKRLVLIEEVRVGEEPGVDVAVAEVEVSHALVVDVRELFARGGAQDVVEEEEGAGCEEDAAAGEGGVDAGFAVERSAHVDAAAGCNATHVVEEGRGEGLGDFPFFGELADVGFGFFVDVERGEVAGAGGFVEGDVGGSAEFPVFGEGTEVLDPFFAALLVGGLSRLAWRVRRVRKELTCRRMMSPLRITSSNVRSISTSFVVPSSLVVSSTSSSKSTSDPDSIWSSIGDAPRCVFRTLAT